MSLFRAFATGAGEEVAAAVAPATPKRIVRGTDQQEVLSACDSPADAETLIGQLFSDERKAGVVTFSTVHRAKGDEADTVYLIDVPGRQPKRDWEARQQTNLRYVALTRSKRRLVFVEPPQPADDE
ncbi:MAG: ATP-binding domain-containing protein [Gemmataceae bacterium]|nr:ATP-binding domain-containing protein [Gemmataceae bacterium]